LSHFQFHDLFSLKISQSGGESEAFLGNQNLGESFQIITKASMGMAGGAGNDGILSDWKASQKALKTEKVWLPREYSRNE
jgi:hypothetical protein